MFLRTGLAPSPLFVYPSGTMPLAEPRPVAVVVMAKTSLAGATKTRLIGALTPEEAAELYSAMFADRCAEIAALPGVIPAVAFAPRADGGAGGPVPEGFRVVPQPPGDLGACLEAAADFFLRDGTAVLLVDSDSPTMPRSFLAEAVESLRGEPSAEAIDLVVGPAEDGGYCFIGLRARHAELFRDVPWSTDRVVPLTLERAREAGLRCRVLPTWWDVDTPQDLDRLRLGLLDAIWPRQTAQWLRAHRTDPSLPSEGDPVEPAERWRAPWRRTASRFVHATPWLTLREDDLVLPDLRRTTYTVVETGQCVGILPLLDDGTVLLVRQYRYVADRVTWEMPTGGVHADETPEVAARRELAEEGQVSAGHLEYLGAYHTSKSVMDETAHLFAARELTAVRARPDDTEFFRIENVPFDRVLEMVTNGEITDSMTIIAVLRVALDRASPGA